MEVIKIREFAKFAKSSRYSVQPKAKLNLPLKIIKKPKISRKLKHFGPFGNALLKTAPYINRSTASQGKSMEWFLYDMNPYLKTPLDSQ